MDELQQRIAALEAKIGAIPLIMELVVKQTEALATMRAELTALTAANDSGSRLPGERPHRAVNIDPKLAVQAYKLCHEYHESHKSVRERLGISQSKLRGVLAWPKATFLNYLDQHGLLEYYEGVGQ